MGQVFQHKSTHEGQTTINLLTQLTQQERRVTLQGFNFLPLHQLLLQGVVVGGILDEVVPLLRVGDQIF